jgi:RNA recognition motif-containing protein
MGQRLYVGNLSFHCSQDTLRATFAEAGEVQDVRIITDRETGQSRGFAFVTMGSPEASQKAMATLNGVVVDGRPLRVNEAEERGRTGPGGGGPMGGGGGGMRSPGGAPRGERQVVELAEGEVGNPRPGGHRGW